MLYDDIGIDKDHSTNDKDAWSKTSGIKLLQDHLQNKKASQNQNKKDNTRKPLGSHHMAVIAGLNKVNLKMKDDEMPPPPAINISYATKDAKGSLLGGDWDPLLEYDPLWPNDYEKIMKEKREKREREKELERAKEMEERERKRRERFERAAVVPPNRSLGLDYGDDDDDEEEDHREEEEDKSRSSGAAIAPPPSLLENSDKDPSTNFGVSSVAAKIMAKMGYKEGQGLGREEQGMSTALLVEKTSKRGGKIIHEKDAPLMPPPPPPPLPTPSSLANSSDASSDSITEIMKNPSKVVLLRNMVGPGEVDDDLEPETKEECGKYGEVIKCVIFELTGTVTDDEAVRIFIEFKRVESAIKAVVDLNGRYFGGRIVKATFYDVEKFKKLELRD